MLGDSFGKDDTIASVDSFLSDGALFPFDSIVFHVPVEKPVSFSKFDTISVFDSLHSFDTINGPGSLQEVDAIPVHGSIAASDSFHSFASFHFSDTI